MARGLQMKRILRFIACILLFSIVLVGCKKESEHLTVDEAKYNSVLKIGNVSEMALGKDLVVVNPDSLYDNNDYMLSAKAGLIYDITNKKVVFSKNVFDKMYPASTTKVLACLCALKYIEEYNIDINKEVVVSDVVNNLVYGAKLSGLFEGDKLKLIDVIYCMMLESGNDAALIVAENVAGSVDEFVKLMNEEAKKMGATHSNFCNPHGLFEEEHYTTAYDLYLIVNEAIKNPKLVEIINTDEYIFNYVTASGVSRKRLVYPTNKYKLETVKAPEGVTVIGGKTGYEELAGRCLVIYSKNSENNEFISVVLYSESSETLYKDMNILLGKE